MKTIAKEVLYAAVFPLSIVVPVSIMLTIWLSCIMANLYLWSTGKYGLAVVLALLGTAASILVMRGTGAFVRDWNCHLILLAARNRGERLTRAQVNNLADAAGVMGGWWLADAARWRWLKDRSEMIEGVWLP